MNRKWLPLLVVSFSASVLSLMALAPSPGYGLTPEEATRQGAAAGAAAGRKAAQDEAPEEEPEEGEEGGCCGGGM